MLWGKGWVYSTYVYVIKKEQQLNNSAWVWCIDYKLAFSFLLLELKRKRANLTFEQILHISSSSPCLVQGKEGVRALRIFFTVESSSHVQLYNSERCQQFWPWNILRFRIYDLETLWGFKMCNQTCVQKFFNKFRTSHSRYRTTGLCVCYRTLCAHYSTYYHSSLQKSQIVFCVISFHVF